MMLYLQSNDPSNYGTIDFTSTNLPRLTKLMDYRVVSLMTNASFSVTTSDDYLKVVEFKIVKDEEKGADVEVDVATYRILFEDKGSYTLSELQECLKQASLELSLNNRGLYEIKRGTRFKLTEATHRVNVLLGLYHCQLPLKSDQAGLLVCPSTPYSCVGQLLYLVPRTDAVCYTNARGVEETQSIAYKTNDLIFNGLPIMSSGNGPWFKLRSTELQHLVFTLVDFLFEPVILHSPLYVTLELREALATGSRAVEGGLGKNEVGPSQPLYTSIPVDELHTMPSM